jgi:hypothetical protein
MGYKTRASAGISHVNIGAFVKLAWAHSESVVPGRDRVILDDLLDEPRIRIHYPGGLEAAQSRSAIWLHRPGVEFDDQLKEWQQSRDHVED